MRKCTLLAAVSLSALMATATPKDTKPQGSPQNMDQFITELMSRMTLEEKIGQLNLPVTGEITTGQAKSSDVAKKIEQGLVGGLFNLKGVDRIRDVQKLAVENSRLGIPLLFGMDVIHGYETVFPIPLGLSCSWDMEAVEQSARIAATEASADGICWTFSPMVDISRDPRWGRVSEGNGEDPFLGGAIAQAMVRGYQGADRYNQLSQNNQIMACVKHFALYGAGEAGRDYNTVDMSHNRMYNEYFYPYQAAVEAGAGSVMASFNEVDGVPATANRWLMTDVLRKQWGFDGFVVTDWASAFEMVSHGFAADRKEAAMKAVNAGVDMEMVSGTFLEALPELVKEGKVKEAVLDEAVRNILRIKFRLGLFDRPYTDESLQVMYAPEHLATAKRAATESAILLKNEGDVLPLGTSVKTVAVVGPMADAPHDQLGTWAFDGEKERTVTPLQAIRESMDGKVQVLYEPALVCSRDKNRQGITRAVSAALRADVVLAFVGEESILSGEAHSLADLNLQGAQRELIAALAQTGKPLVTVVMAGRPLTIGDEVEQSSAVLYMFHPGTMGGPALADLLWGKAVPSGKTPVTFPKVVGQIPVYYAHNNTGRPASKQEILLDDIPLEAGQTSLGCTSYYLDAGFEPLFPFGYGLSYTTFRYSEPKLSATELKPGDVLTVTFDLENTGRYEGAEIAQLYVQDKVGSVTRPVKELKRFTRVSLKPGEKKTVTFELPMEELAFWNIDMKRVVEPGDFNLWVAPDSQSGTPVAFKVVE